MSHDPSDCPGVFTQRNASTSGEPVLEVGRTPRPAPGGLHQLPPWSAPSTAAGWLYGAAPYRDGSRGPRPFRLVSMVKGSVATAVPMSPWICAVTLAAYSAL